MALIPEFAGRCSVVVDKDCERTVPCFEVLSTLPTGIKIQLN